MKEVPTPAVPEGESSRKLLRSIRFCLVLLLLLAAGYTVIYAKPVLLPLLLALLLTLVLRPFQWALCAIRLPAPLAAALIVGALLAGTVAGASYLAGPAATWLSTLEQEYAERKIKEFFAPVKDVRKGLKDVAKKVDSLTEEEEEEEEDEKEEGDEEEDSPADRLEPEDDAENGTAEATGLEAEPTSTGDSSSEDASTEDASTEDASTEDASTEENGEKEKKKEPVEVEIRERTASTVMEYLQSFGVHAVATMLLIFFFLAYGDVLHHRLAETKGTADVFESVRRDVSVYLFTVTSINVVLGTCVALAMWWLEMPNPMLWGVMATLLNFIPYLGALTGTVVVGLAAIVNFPTSAEALLIPAVYLGLTSLEGNVATPMIIGHRFSLNPIVVVVWFLSWGAMWGIPGMLIATPTLMGFKIVCSKLPALSRLDRAITG
ncbi:MAG: AI-2E family transporter [Verrucomicrobiales bacterium]